MSAAAEEAAAPGGLNALDALAQLAEADDAGGRAVAYVPPPNACCVLTRDCTSPLEQELRAVPEIR